MKVRTSDIFRVNIVPFYTNKIIVTDYSIFFIW